MQHHEACSYCYIVVRCDGQTELPVEYRGPSAAEHFLEALQEEERKITTGLANPSGMQMTREDWRTHNSVTTCHVCEKPLEGDSVRDHCHITGKYGTTHNACNLKLWLNPKTTAIPVIFHNLRGYDSHLLLQAISKMEGRIVSPTTRRSISLSPWANCDSSKAYSFCRPRLISWLRQTSLKRVGSRRGTSRPKRGANCLYARASTHTSTWTHASALPSPNLPPRKPSSASFQTSTSAMRSTGMHSAAGRFSTAKQWGTTTLFKTAATSYCWRMSSRHLERPAWDSMALTPQTITPARVSHGTPCSRKWGLSLSFSPISTNTSSSKRVCVVACAWPQFAMQGLTTPGWELPLRLGNEPAFAHGWLSEGGLWHACW